MSSKPDSFDDLEPTETTTDDGGTDWIDLDPGQEVIGTITGLNLDAGYNGVVELDGRPMYLNNNLKNQIIAALVVGNTMGVRKSEDVEKFTNDDGEQEYHPKEARFDR
ncbi:hypothetical protein [Halomicrobium sp. LC1Hm]|uniref:hypothetical protein n=1 Tax=Halomicrobium sp. LC1Hm TaxID=2610902 RepID=UPI00129849A8|nr:hypothetical protein [Halomicrobium sp. LC1Hm]QGA81100.1 hypothetical protein LC1Hm_0029 [Halomicrobium sp. LC1Hm]